MLLPIKIIFTKHAIERLQESGLPLKGGVSLVEESQEEKLPRDVIESKREKYNGNQGVFYRRNGTFVFVTKYIIDRFTFRPILLVLTLTDQRVTLKY